VQLRLRVSGSCGVVARLRAVVRRDDGPRRWYVCFAALYRVGDRRRVVQLFWRVDFFFVGASHVCSSHSIHGVFSLALGGGRLVLVECGVVLALRLLY
jgi:hypothetical protein